MSGSIDMIRHVLCCECGNELECQAEDMRIGRAYQCPDCKKYWGRVQGPYGNGWFELDPQRVEFTGIFQKPELDDDEI